MKTYKMYMILPSAIIQMLELKLQSLNFKLTDKVRDVE